MRFWSAALAAMIVAGAAAYAFRAELGTAVPALRPVLALIDRAPAGGPGRAGGPPVPAVVTARAETIDLPIVRTAFGFVESPSVVTVRSRIDSQIAEQHFEDGQFVRKGDLLFTLDDREIRAALARDEAAVASAEATLAKASEDRARAEQLLARGVGTQTTVNDAFVAERVAKALLRAATAAAEANRIRLDYTRILAPIDGRTGSTNVAPGNLVDANGGSGLVTITQMRPIEVRFTMPESEAKSLRDAIASDRPMTVTVTSAGGPPVEGRLSFVDSAIDVASGTIAARATMPNDDLALWPGQYVDVSAVFETIAGAVAVPTVAVQQGQAGPYVFVIDGEGKARLRPVSIRASEGGRTAIAEGLEAGERVVIDGQMRLRDGLAVRETEAGAAPAAKKAAGS